MFKVNLFALFTMSALFGHAQTTDVTFGVSGLCKMCENRIEKAFDQKGIISADYNLESHQIHVVYKTEKWSLESLHKLATAIGHDTDKYRSTDAQYNQLHGCCKYRGVEGGSCKENGHKP